MVQLKQLFKNDALVGQHGKKIRKLVRKSIINEEHVHIDFVGIKSVSLDFFQELMLPLVIEFGSTSVQLRLRFLNIHDELSEIYSTSLKQKDEFIDNYFTQKITRSDEIYNLTLGFLLKARELLRTDPVMANFVFGIGKEMSDALITMDIESLQKIASSGVICFEPRISLEFAAKAAAMEPEEIDVLLNVAGSMIGQ
jgi:hypothetical protein